MSSPSPAAPVKMTYRFLGDSGLLVSKLALGSWMFAQPSYTSDAWFELMKTAFANGINFFDTSETYVGGRADVMLGEAIKRGVAEQLWSREDLVVSSKIFAGSKGMFDCGPNDQGQSRKHLVEGIKASLQRLQLEYVDVIYCHRCEPFTPIEETVRAMNFIISQGWAFYWGTSGWTVDEFIEACDIADRLGLIRPIVEEQQYNIFERTDVEFSNIPLYKKYKLGLSTWSPLAEGILTGKYSNTSIPEGSRLANSNIRNYLTGFEDKARKTQQLEPIAARLGCTLAQLAIAWCISNEHATTVLLGARSPEQLQETVQAVRFVDKLTPEVKAEIDAIVQFVPKLTETEPLTRMRERHVTGEQPDHPAWADAMDEQK